MIYTVNTLKNSVSGILSGVKLDNITALYAAFERAARTLVQKAHIPEAMAKQAITVYDGVYDYTSPTTIFGGALLDFRPQGDDRGSTDFVYKKPIELFDRTKALLPNGSMLTFEFEKGVGKIRISSTRATNKITLDTFSDYTKWTASGITGLSDDETDYYWSPSAIRFNITAGGSQATITRTLDSKLDLTDYEGVGVVFLAVKIPSATAITSIGIKLGSSSTQYFSVSNTAGFLGAWTANEWTIIALDLALATETLTVDITKVNYLQVYFNFDGTAQTNVRVGGCWISLPSPYNLYFSTAAIFLATGGTPSQLITEDSDQLLLGDAAYTLYEYESALSALQQSGGTLSSPMYQMLTAKLHGSGNDLGLYALYRVDNPSEKLKVVGSYYD